MPGKMLPVATVGCVTDPFTGAFGLTALMPNGLGKILGGPNQTVRAAGRPIATLDSIVSVHGNPVDPKLPGYNPECATSTLSEIQASATVLVMGLPVAVSAPGMNGTIATCSHYCFTSLAPTILIGGVV